MNHTDLPDLSKPMFSRSNRGKPKFTDKNFEKQLEKSLLIPSNGGFAKVPTGSEPIHLDLEKLFLLSVSNEHLDFSGKIQKNLPDKKSKK